MEIIKPGTKIDFMGIKWWAMGLSGLLILIGIVSLVLHGGPRYGIDFAGGLLVEVRFEKPISSAEIEQAMKEKGLPAPQVQNAWGIGKAAGQEFILRMDLGTGAPETVAR
jgi:preprotein translocase subunit SecF